MFSRLRVERYRAVGPAPVDLELRPLTVLVGPNGAGKSALLETLPLTAQSVHEDFQRQDLVIKGTKLQIVAPSETEEDSFLYFGGDTSKALSVELELRRQGAPGRFSYRWARTGVHPNTAWSHRFSADGGLLLELRLRRELLGLNATQMIEEAVIEHDGREVAHRLPVHIAMERLLPRGLLHPGHFAQMDEEIRGAMTTRAQQADALAAEMRDALDDVYLLGALRGRETMHRDTGKVREIRSVGLRGQDTVRLLSVANGKARLDAARDFASRFDLGDLTPGWVGGERLRATYVDPATSLQFEHLAAATGSLQALTLVAQCLLTPEGSALIIEEPECNLHPKYEHQLPELFAASIAGARQVLLSTHSEVLIASIGSAVRRGRLRDDDVALYELTRDAEGVHPRRIEITKRGYLDEWVRSYAEVDEALYQEWEESLPPASVRQDGGAVGGGHDGSGASATQKARSRPQKTRGGRRVR